MRRSNIDVANFVAQTPLFETTWSRLERARLHHITAHGEKRFVDALDDVRTRQNEMIVAPFQRLSAEILGRKVLPLDVRPHRAVVNQHSAL